MKHRPSKILIFTASIGSGHLSIARSIAEAVKHIGKDNVRVELVDFITALSNIAITATKTIYLNSLKLSPKIYEIIFSHSHDKKWPVKLLNLLSAPFMQQKFISLLKEKKPDVLVSTYPIWDTIIKKIWEKYSGGALPFVSVVTDSINVHSAWMTGRPDFFIVPNEDTKTSLRNFGIESSKIKVFGSPVNARFFENSKLDRFRQKRSLSPHKKTILFVISEGLRLSRVKKLAAKILQSSLKNIQLQIITAANEDLRKKLQAINWPWPTKIYGWTDEMHNFIKSADLVITKAGGCTVMECISCKKPMIIADAIPGHEMGNVLLVQKYNLGVILNDDLSNFDWAISYIFNNEHLIKKNLAVQQRPNAAKDIAKFLIELAKKGKSVR